MNIQQQTTSEVANREIVMSENAEKDTPPPQAIYNVFSEAELLSGSSSDSDKYKSAWFNAKVIRFAILSAGECPYACSRKLSIAPNHKEIDPIIVSDLRQLPQKIRQYN